MKKVIFILVFTLTFQKGYSQGCCSGGVPMSANVGLPVSDAGSWQFSVNYDLNVLSTLKNGTETLDDDRQKRTTHSVLAQVGYTLNNRLSLELFSSFVRQERRIKQLNQEYDFIATNGLGDAIFLAKYRLYKNFQIGLGTKVPTGASDKKDNRGIPLGADLQPGSGAWDLVYWAGGGAAFPFRKSMFLNVSVIYRSTGVNDNFFGDSKYKFGNEFQSTIGIADRFVLGSITLDPSISIKYRKANPDKRNVDKTVFVDFGSTGGEWVFIRPAISYNPSPSIAIQSNIELPVYAKLNDTQVSPTYRINIGVTFILKRKNDFKID
jgi:hypothetical protein